MMSITRAAAFTAARPRSNSQLQRDVRQAVFEAAGLFDDDIIEDEDDSDDSEEGQGQQPSAERSPTTTSSSFPSLIMSDTSSSSSSSVPVSVIASLSPSTRSRANTTLLKQYQADGIKAFNNGDYQQVNNIRRTSIDNVVHAALLLFSFGYCSVSVPLLMDCYCFLVSLMLLYRFVLFLG